MDTLPSAKRLRMPGSHSRRCSSFFVQRAFVLLFKIDANARSFGLRTAITVFTVLVANLDIDFVSAKSICPARPSHELPAWILQYFLSVRICLCHEACPLIFVGVMSLHKLDLLRSLGGLFEDRSLRYGCLSCNNVVCHRQSSCPAILLCARRSPFGVLTPALSILRSSRLANLCSISFSSIEIHPLGCSVHTSIFRFSR